MHTTDFDLAEQIAYINQITFEAARELVADLISQIEQVDGKEIDVDAISNEDSEFIINTVNEMRRNGELGNKILDEISEQLLVVSDAQDRLSTEIAHRDALIKKALQHGARLKDVAEVMGVSVQRVSAINKA